MMDVLQFVFASFWNWLGTVVILAVILSGPRRMFESFAVKSKKKVLPEQEP